jgi:hypothetical protein
MRAVRKHLETGVQLAKGMSRAEFEKPFGLGKKLVPKPDAHFKADPSWEYAVGNGTLQVWYDDDGAKVRSISGSTAEKLPLGPSPEFGRLARAFADGERKLLREFLTKRFSGVPAAGKEPLRTLLQKSADDLQWTEEESKQMVGD